MDFRHEWKHEINTADYFSLKSRLSAVMKYDSHYPDGTYETAHSEKSWTA